MHGMRILAGIYMVIGEPINNFSQTILMIANKLFDFHMDHFFYEYILPNIMM